MASGTQPSGLAWGVATVPGDAVSASHFGVQLAVKLAYTTVPASVRIAVAGREQDISLAIHLKG